MLVTQCQPDKSSYIVCIQNLPTDCSEHDVTDLLNSMFTFHLLTSLCVSVCTVNMQWVSRALSPTRHLTGHFGDKSFAVSRLGCLYVAYFTAQSCLRPPENDQNIPYLSPVPKSAKLRKNTEIPQKWANSVAALQIPCAAENCDPYLLATFLYCIHLTRAIASHSFLPIE